MNILFIITSAIYVGNTYTIYKPSERLEQTIKTIQTIQKKVTKNNHERKQ